MSGRRYQRGAAGDWLAKDSVHAVSLMLTACTRLRQLAVAQHLPRIKSATQLAAAMTRNGFEEQLVAMAPQIWSLYVERDEGDDK